MADWTSSMQQTFEYYVVDPGTWKDVRKVDTVRSCTISWDWESSTLSTATFNITESLGECYLRIYLITVQNGIREKHPLGTYIVQTPTTVFNGKVRDVTTDAYSPLLELKENPPPYGYSILKESNIMDDAYVLTQEHVRAPVVRTECDIAICYDFVSDSEDTWLSFLTDYISNANYLYSLDEMGRILFAPKQETASLQPVWAYTDDNSSILQPSVTVDHDIYGIPNVVEVIYSNGDEFFYARAVNDDPNSPISTVNRGRPITHRVTDPEIAGNPTAEQIKEYAERTLKEMSAVEYTVTYTHGYCPVRIGDCVMLNYARAGLKNIKARVINQSITCETSCQVEETAVYTMNLWR